jgi:hypothetical protein
VVQGRGLEKVSGQGGERKDVKTGTNIGTKLENKLNLATSFRVDNLVSTIKPRE